MASPLPLPRDLTIPEPGSTIARDVLSRSLGRLLPDLAAIPRSLPSSARGKAELEATLGAVRRAAQESRGAAAILSALRSPTVGALVRSLRNELLRRAAFDRDRAESMVIDLCATLALELALAGVLAEELRLTRLPARILSLGARAGVEVPPSATAMIFAAGRATIAREGERIEVDLPAIARGEEHALVTRPYHPIALTSRWPPPTTTRAPPSAPSRASRGTPSISAGTRRPPGPRRCATRWRSSRRTSRSSRAR